MAPSLPPEEYALGNLLISFHVTHCSQLIQMSGEFTEENEERSMVEPKSMEDIKLKALIAVLVDWINDELAEHRMIVQNVDEDLYDGQVLQKLLGNSYIFILSLVLIQFVLGSLDDKM